VWRDPAGRITRQGDLRAVTAECSDGRVWDVSGNNPILVKPNGPICLKAHIAANGTEAANE
jgi:hypothetical protein